MRLQICTALIFLCCYLHILDALPVQKDSNKHGKPDKGNVTSLAVGGQHDQIVESKQNQGGKENVPLLKEIDKPIPKMVKIKHGTHAKRPKKNPKPKRSWQKNKKGSRKNRNRKGKGGSKKGKSQRKPKGPKGSINVHGIPCCIEENCLLINGLPPCPFLGGGIEYYARRLGRRH